MDDNFEYRLRQLEKFRDKYESQIESLMEQKVIDKAVKEAVKKNNRVYLTWSQRVTAAVVIALTIVQSLHDIFG